MRIQDLARELEATLESSQPAALGSSPDPNTQPLDITGIASLEQAANHELAFCVDDRHLAKAASSRAGALLVGARAAVPAGVQALLLRCPEPQVAAARAIELLRPAWRPRPGISPSASIDSSARLGRDCYVGPFAVIGPGCVVGDRAIIHPHAVLYADVVAGDDLLLHAHAVLREGTRIGNRVIIQPGVVLGGDGYGFARRRDGVHIKVPQVGNVIVEDDVEIQSNSCIDRATLDSTLIRQGAKIDNLVQVAHNCEVGERNLLCSQVGLAGSTKLESDCILAGQAGVAGHCTIGKGAIITAQSGTHGDLEGGKIYSGSPAFDNRQWLRSVAAFRKLDELMKAVQRLQKQMLPGNNDPHRNDQVAG